MYRVHDLGQSELPKTKDFSVSILLMWSNDLLRQLQDINSPY